MTGGFYDVCYLFNVCSYCNKTALFAHTHTHTHTHTHQHTYSIWFFKNRIDWTRWSGQLPQRANMHFTDCQNDSVSQKCRVAMGNVGTYGGGAKYPLSSVKKCDTRWWQWSTCSLYSLLSVEIPGHWEDEWKPIWTGHEQDLSLKGLNTHESLSATHYTGLCVFIYLYRCIQSCSGNLAYTFMFVCWGLFVKISKQIFFFNGPIYPRSYFLRVF